MRIFHKIKLFLKNLRQKCPNCENGRIRYLGSDWTGRIWIEVYECDKCKTEFV